jgi:hypothetical protein
MLITSKMIIRNSKMKRRLSPVETLAIVCRLMLMQMMGLRFPLTKEQVVIHEEWHGSLADQEAAILAAFPTEIEIANAGSPFTFEEKDAQATVSMNALSEVMKAHSTWYDLRLKPPDGKFETIYEIAVTSLEVPQMINLEAI